MITYQHRECPHCGFEIEIEVEIGEGAYPPSECPECMKPVDFSADDFQADAVADLADRYRAAHGEGGEG